MENITIFLMFGVQSIGFLLYLSTIMYQIIVSKVIKIRISEFKSILYNEI